MIIDITRVIYTHVDCGLRVNKATSYFRMLYKILFIQITRKNDNATKTKYFPLTNCTQIQQIVPLCSTTTVSHEHALRYILDLMKLIVYKLFALFQINVSKEYTKY